jgi:general secretion pathway protein H
MGLYRMTTATRHRTCLAGFTLIEIVLVLLIAGILAAAAAPKFAESMASFRLQAVAHRIAGDIRYARRLAQQQSATLTIVFDVLSNSYTLTGVTNVNRRTSAYQFSLSELEYDCEMLSADFNGVATLTFDVYGRPTNTGTIVVRCGSDSLTLTLDELGQISVS